MFEIFQPLLPCSISHRLRIPPSLIGKAFQVVPRGFASAAKRIWRTRNNPLKICTVDNTEKGKSEYGHGRRM